MLGEHAFTLDILGGEARISFFTERDQPLSGRIRGCQSDEKKVASLCSHGRGNFGKGSPQKSSRRDREGRNRRKHAGYPSLPRSTSFRVVYWTRTENLGAVFCAIDFFFHVVHIWMGRQWPKMLPERWHHPNQSWPLSTFIMKFHPRSLSQIEEDFLCQRNKKASASESRLKVNVFPCQGKCLFSSSRSEPRSRFLGWGKKSDKWDAAYPKALTERK